MNVNAAETYGGYEWPWPSGDIHSPSNRIFAIHYALNVMADYSDHACAIVEGEMKKILLRQVEPSEADKTTLAGLAAIYDAICWLEYPEGKTFH